MAFPKMFIHSFLTSSYHYLAIAGAVFVALIGASIAKKKNRNRPSIQTWVPALIGLCSALLFLSMLGRASRLYFVHLYPWLVLLFVISVSRLSKSRTVSYLILSGAILVCAAHLLLYGLWFRDANPRAYNEEIRRHIPVGSTVLGRIHHQLVLGETNRYLAFLDIAKYGGTVNALPDYIETYNVDYVLYDHESRSRKVYTDLGIGKYLKTHGTHVVTIKDPYYGSRYFDQRGSPFYGVLWFWLERSNKPEMYTTSIYRVLQE